MTTIVDTMLVRASYEYGGQSFEIVSHCKNSTEMLDALHYMQNTIGYFDEDVEIRLSAFDENGDIIALEWHK